jgi:TrpR-related protein YerC/YecD
MSENYPDKLDKKMIKAFSLLKGEKEIENFLRDLLTIGEIKEASKRFEIATMLWQGGLTYEQIAKRAKTSTTTVTRVAHWLVKKGLDGYRTVLMRMYPKKR